MPNEHPTSATSITRRQCARIDKSEWWTDPRAVVRLALWMIDNGYERAEIERMAYKPRCYEVERVQCELEAGIALCAESARERRGA